MQIDVEKIRIYTFWMRNAGIIKSRFMYKVNDKMGGLLIIYIKFSIE